METVGFIILGLVFFTAGYLVGRPRKLPDLPFGNESALSRWHIVETLPGGAEEFAAFSLTDSDCSAVLGSSGWENCRRVPTNYKLKK